MKKKKVIGAQTKLISVYLPPQYIVELDRIAKGESTTRGCLFRKIIKFYINKYANPDLYQDEKF